MVAFLACGLRGSTFSKTAAMHALERGKHHERLAAAWLPPGVHLGRTLAQTRRTLEATIARAPRSADGLPCSGSSGFKMGQASQYTKHVNRQCCSACGHSAHQVKRCGQCRSVACERAASPACK